MAQLDNKIQVAIYSPNGLVYDHKSLGCNMQTDDGGLSILPNHVPIMMSLEIGAVVVTRSDGTKNYIAVDGGVASFEANKLTIMATFAIRARDIDTVQAEIDKQNAEAAMFDAQEEDDSSAYRRAKVQLSRAINQIDISRHLRQKN